MVLLLKLLPPVLAVLEPLDFLQILAVISILGMGVFILLCIYLVWALHALRAETNDQHKAASTAGIKRMETITQKIDAMDTRLMGHLLEEMKVVYNALNPLRERVARIEGKLDIDPPAEDVLQPDRTTTTLSTH